MYSTLEIVNGTDSTDSPSVDLATLEFVKTELGITGTDEDATLAARITLKSKDLLAICDLIYPLTDVIETFRFDACERFRTLVLRRVPIHDITSIVEDGVELDASAVSFDPDAGLLRKIDGGYWGGTVVATYSAGYDLPSEAPGPLISELIDLVQDARVAGSLSADPLASFPQMVKHGDKEVSYFKTSSGDGAASVTTSMLDRLARYRSVVMA